MFTGGTLLGGAIILILVIVAATSVLDLGASTDDYDDYYDDEYYEYGGIVTINQVLDPWMPDDPEVTTDEGTRFVAVDVTIENDRTGDASEVYILSFYFRATDEDRFVYQASEETKKTPALPDGLFLSSGEKTRGWLVFQVAEDAVIESLTYYDEVVPLHEDTGGPVSDT